MIADDTLAMRDVWSWSLSWLRRPMADEGKRARRIVVVAAILAELRRIGTVPALHGLYATDHRWCVTIARRLYPQEWATLGVSAMTGAAFGLRYVEITTGATLDPADLPVWVSEFAVW